MKIAVEPFKKRGKADALILPVWEGELASGLKQLGESEAELKTLISTNDFKAKLGDTLLIYREKAPEPRLLLLGLGPESKVKKEPIRRAYAQAVRALRAKEARGVNVFLPHSRKISRSEVLEAVSDGIFLTNYAFTRLKGESLKENPSVLLEKVVFLDVDASETERLQRKKIIAAGVHLARDLVNMNADDKTASVLAKAAKEFEKTSSLIETKVFDKKKLEQEKMGLLLAVNRGSSHEPCLIFSSYKGDPSSKEHVVLVGKGMSYDTGGLNLKPGDNMLTMKCDMSGAATVLATVRTAAELGLKINVTALAPVAENCIDADSYKPGDVYKAYNGKTVEITNTDAEGRLILADAMSYAAKNLHPSCMIDVASLTGAIVIALGENVAGLFSTQDHLSHELLKASAETDELLWRMPLHEDYRESMKSEIADLINSGTRDGSSIKAALFLQEFVGEVPWAHLDIAGSCYHTKPKFYYTSPATGFGVRLLVEFLANKASS